MPNKSRITSSEISLMDRMDTIMRTSSENQDTTFDQAVRAMAVQAADLVIGKQRDYGPKNILNCPVGPDMGIIVRLSDKLSRAANLLSTGATPENESFADTINDIIGYGLVWKMVIEGKFELPLENK